MIAYKFCWVLLMPREECCGVMGMSRNVDSCPAGSAAVSTMHDIKTWAFYLVKCTQRFPNVHLFVAATLIFYFWSYQISVKVSHLCSVVGDKVSRWTQSFLALNCPRGAVGGHCTNPPLTNEWPAVEDCSWGYSYKQVCSAPQSWHRGRLSFLLTDRNTTASACPVLEAVRTFQQASVVVSGLGRTVFFLSLYLWSTLLREE